MKKSLETIKDMAVDIGRLTFDNRYRILRDVAKTGRDISALIGAWYLASQAVDIPVYKPFIAHGGLVGFVLGIDLTARLASNQLRRMRYMLIPQKF